MRSLEARRFRASAVTFMGARRLHENQISLRLSGNSDTSKDTFAFGTTFALQ